jgi:hypothetical protein
MAEALETRVPAKLLVAAIDFGTTYTGIGFSMRATYQEDPTKIWTKRLETNRRRSSISIRKNTNVSVTYTRQRLPCHVRKTNISDGTTLRILR